MHPARENIPNSGAISKIPAVLFPMPNLAILVAVMTAVYLMMLLHTLLASGTHIIAKTTVTNVDPVTLTFLRTLTAGLILALLAAAGKTSLRVERSDRGTFLLLSALGVPVNQFLFLTGIHASRPTNAALFYGATPALVLLLSVLMKKEEPSATRLAGVVVAFAGILIVVFERGLDLGGETLTGDLLLLAAVVAWTFYTVLGRDVIAKYGPARATSVVLVWGMAMYLPFGFVPALRFDYSSLSAADAGGIAYLAVVTSIVAYAIWYYALGRMAPSKVAVFSNIQPALTVVLAWLLLGDVLTPRFLLGAGVTLAGVVITETG
jgi:drug/metabolite transporter (DMT)-like permease